MRCKQLAKGADLTSATPGDEIVLTSEKAPFLPNYTTIVCLSSVDLDSSVLQLQGRDGAEGDWAVLEDVNGDDVELDEAGQAFFEVVLPERIRVVAVPDTGGTPAGSGDAALLGN